MADSKENRHLVTGPCSSFYFLAWLDTFWSCNPNSTCCWKCAYLSAVLRIYIGLRVSENRF